MTSENHLGLFKKKKRKMTAVETPSSPGVQLQVRLLSDLISCKTRATLSLYRPLGVFEC